MPQVCKQYQQSPSHVGRKMTGISFVVFLFLAQTAVALTPAGLKTEYLENPQGLDVLHPRLSWIFTATGRAQKQAAYQIQVAKSAEQFKSGKSAIWDSGKVDSDQNFGIVYGGPAFENGTVAAGRLEGEVDWRLGRDDVSTAAQRIPGGQEG